MELIIGLAAGVIGLIAGLILVADDGTLSDQDAGASGDGYD